MKILIADDSKLSRVTLENALSQLGHEVIAAQSGEEAIIFFKEERPDLIILDVVMKGMNGFECATAIRKIDSRDWIPIIFLSSSIDDAYIARGIDAGGDDYLTKPFSPITLSAKIKSMQRIADMRNELIQTTYKLKVLSSTDSLTNIYNRLQFDKTLIEVIANSKRFQDKFALFFIDIDHFKEVNDTLGHHKGDLLLIEIAKRLTSCLRKDDFLARQGGDEFAIILRRIRNMADIEEVARKIINLSKTPYVLEDSTITITFSIGIANFPEAGEESEALMGNADIALYYVKEAGRNNFKIFTPNMKKAKEHSF